MKKRVDVFAVSIYVLVVFPKALGHVDEAVSDLFNQLDKRVTLIPVILAETFRSLNACRRAGEGRFIGCAQLLLAWFHNHFWKRKDGWRSSKISKKRISSGEPLGWFLTRSYTDVGILTESPYLGFGFRVGYAYLLVLRQYRLRQFIPATYGLAQCEFLNKRDNYKKVREMSNAWNQTRRMKKLAIGPITTPEYNGWKSKRINDNIPEQNQEGARSMEEYLQMVPFELELIKQDFERKNAELGKKIEQLEEEKMHLRLDVDIQKLEIQKWRKGKNKAEEDLDRLKMDYKKLHLSMRTARLGKMSEQWRHEI
ncbi:hypothetical protein PVK06_007703 [Gossypium arboreum]|uniref:DUF7745 domain-containing protein n=1 Tax=Gossypium arboreum TaxID=29729 RepID=A0ABR0QID2_GOSAR|nr:hypothetical protein PVK06_007703 [Gossypium arboreum]